MSLTLSTMLPLGTKAPDFNLVDAISNKNVSLQNIRGEKGTVVMFICNHCPYVKHVNDEIVRVSNDYRVTGFGFVAISSNDIINYPEDSPQIMWETARKIIIHFHTCTMKLRKLQKPMMQPVLPISICSMRN